MLLSSEDGKTGIYLAGSLLDGSSAGSLTFGNNVLCASSEASSPNPQIGATAKFEIMGLEVWGLSGA